MNPTPKIKKVVFYSGPLRAFRSLLIGYLYEISQTYPVILLSEKLDSETKKILKDKTLFPRLEEIIPIYHCTEGKMNLLVNHRCSCKLAKDIIHHYKPDIIIVSGYTFLGSYLRRFARRINAINICFVGFIFEQTKEAVVEYILKIAYLKAPKFLPWRGKILFSKLRRYLGHFLCYWILPLLIGQQPFLKEPSRVLVGDYFRFGGVDYFVVFSKREYNILIRDGVPAQKLYILPHPLMREGRAKILFGKIYTLDITDKNKINTKILTVMWPSESIGFKRGNFVLISKEESWKSRKETITLIAKILKGWKIFIKPHPMIKDDPGQFQEIVQTLESISNQIKVVNPSEPADKYIEMSDVIVGLSPASTSLSDAFLQCPKKPILSLDLQYEFYGDSYKNFNGIEYINSKEKFINILKLIQSNKYRKHYQKHKKEELGEREFSSTPELLEYLFNKKKSHIYEI